MHVTENACGFMWQSVYGGELLLYVLSSRAMLVARASSGHTDIANTRLSNPCQQNALVINHCGEDDLRHQAHIGITLW